MEHETHEEESLLNKARRLYRNRPAYVRVGEVANHVGRSTEWLRLFGNGKIENPGLVSIEKLISYVEERTQKGA